MKPKTRKRALRVSSSSSIAAVIVLLLVWTHEREFDETRTKGTNGVDGTCSTSARGSKWKSARAVLGPSNGRATRVLVRFFWGRKTRTTAAFFRVSTKAVRALGPSNSRTARWPAGIYFYGTPAASRINPQSRSFLVGSVRCFTSRDLLYLLRVFRAALRVF
jgi:hypothetical protein